MTDFKDIKAKYKIPYYYDDGLQMVDGRIVFSYCDSTTTIHPNGVIEECHENLSSDVINPNFVTMPWLPWRS